MENKEQVEQFVALNKKDLSELRAVAEGLGVNTEGTRADIIDRLLTSNPQRSILLDQAIPLRTRDSQGNEIPGTNKMYLKWRKLLFNGKGNRKAFNLLNTNGSRYSATMKYIKCSKETLTHILKNSWYMPVQNQQDLISTLKHSSEQYDVNIVQKYNKKGNSFLMLHVSRKAS